MKETMTVHVIGAGLAGSEATWQLVSRKIPVKLHEMRPKKSDPAHHTAYYSELVCSNSLRADNIENAVGLLKEEMRRLDSLIMAQADAHRVPAGGHWLSTVWVLPKESRKPQESSARDSH